MEAVSQNQRSQQRRAMFCLRLQTAYRARLGRRAMWRRRKLWVHARETRAAIVIQCAIRVHLAWKKVKRQRAMSQYLQFVGVLGGKGKMTYEEALTHAAIVVQGCWRRKKAYNQARRMKGSRQYYERMKKKYGKDRKIEMEDLEGMAAAKMQAMWKGKKARRLTSAMAEKIKAQKQEIAAIKIQKIVRGRQTRKRVLAQKNERKMRRLGNFFRGACFLKCWLTWIKFTDEAVHFKEVANRTLGRWLNRGLVAGFNALAMYAQAKKDKREKVQKAALLIGKRDQGPRDRMWGYWADFMDDKRELWIQVQTKCSKFLHLLAADSASKAYMEWKDITSKNRKAKKRRKHYKLFQGWKAWMQAMADIKHFKGIAATIKQKWAVTMQREGLLDFKECIDDLLYNRSLVGDSCMMWMNKTVIHAFRSLDDHAQAQIHYRVTVANFRRRYELRTVMPMIRGWHEWTQTKLERKRIAAGAAFKLYARMIQSCIETWCGIIRDRKLGEREMAAKGSKTLMRIAKRPMVVSFERWKNYSAEQTRHRQIVARISYRWRNANVVFTFSNWITFVDLAIEERMKMLREAVLDAMQTGDLITLMRTAKQQRRKYHRANLEDVMKQVLAEEHDQVEQIVQSQGLMNPMLLGGAGAGAAMQGMVRGNRSPPRGRAGASPPRQRPGRQQQQQQPQKQQQQQLRAGPGGGGTYPEEVASGPMAPQMRASGGGGGGGGGSFKGASKSKTQILPAYLQSASGKGGGGGGRGGPGGSMQRSYSEGFDSFDDVGGGVQQAMSAAAPGEDDMRIYGLDVGDTTAYPLMGFDASLPERSYDNVKSSLSQFEQAANRPGKRRGVVFPPIKTAKPAWPAMDDTENISVGMTGSVADARVDTTLPPVVAAPVSMPMIVDD